MIKVFASGYPGRVSFQSFVSAGSTFGGSACAALWIFLGKREKTEVTLSNFNFNRGSSRVRNGNETGTDLVRAKTIMMWLMSKTERKCCDRGRISSLTLTT